MTNLDIVWKSKDIILLMNVHIVKAVTCSHVQMWKVDHKVGWAPENWCFWIVVLEKTLESPLDCKEIKPVHPKGNQPWIYVGRTDAEAPVLWPPDAKNWLIGKDPDAGKDWMQNEKRKIEDEIVGWHHRTQWTWVWASSASWWWTGKPGVLQSIRQQSQTGLSDWTNWGLLDVGCADRGRCEDGREGVFLFCVLLL